MSSENYVGIIMAENLRFPVARKGVWYAKVPVPQTDTGR